MVGSHRSAAVILFTDQNVDARELRHRDLFALHDLAADLGPKSDLCVDIARVQVNMPNCAPGRVGSRELGKRRSHGKCGDCEEKWSLHSTLLYQSAGRLARGR